ncbi:ABC transporter ATP-binding protein [Fictibacillus phosphorivorans]|uniref:ABC transporter ATP-binding protein n=1 Tax=Fictibacillus phosphorivorans TaxID=1221500 RepID=UPI00203F6387|nr:ABC transporter ATP-binding protein [Fictibacillus phosphorivorans]MCM3717644.1 ABC transporter ATP-binding protein [Fictibacillus phosphorivorans]MCM3775544.1 ABC transporter ATP-binding protein [Fictibacillus phosphorivorans]
MITAQNLSKKFGRKEVLQNLNFHIQKGEIVGVVGPNGAGKSTLLKIIATIMRGTNGSVQIDGLDTKKETKKIREKIGYVPQEIAVYHELTARENLRFFAKLAKNSSEESWMRRCEEWKLAPHLDKKVKHLSGGNQRKLNILIALLHHPDILILDEPTVGIDISAKQEIVNDLRELGSEGKTILYSSHDAQELETLCTSFLILKEGELLFYGSKQKVRQFGSVAQAKNFAETLGEIVG